MKQNYLIPKAFSQESQLHEKGRMKHETERNRDWRDEPKNLSFTASQIPSCEAETRAKKEAALQN